MLRVDSLVVGYGATVVHGVTLELEEGSAVAVIGPNGAGKTTLLRAVTGMKRVEGGTVTFDGRDITRLDAPAIARTGIAHVPENRRVFAAHTVEDNLRLGAWVRRGNRPEVKQDLSRIYDRFPRLKERRSRPAGLLSGGEQQMLALGMALMARPRLLILDEPSLGLAPIIVSEVFEHLAQLKREGMTILLVEQFAAEALKLADRGYVLNLGNVVFEGSAEELRRDEQVVAAYLG